MFSFDPLHLNLLNKKPISLPALHAGTLLWGWMGWCRVYWTWHRTRCTGWAWQWCWGRGRSGWCPSRTQSSPWSINLSGRCMGEGNAAHLKTHKHRGGHFYFHFMDFLHTAKKECGHVSQTTSDWDLKPLFHWPKNPLTHWHLAFFSAMGYGWIQSTLAPSSNDSAVNTGFFLLWLWSTVIETRPPRRVH